MAKEVDLTSDSLDEYITTISGGHLNYLKQRLAHHLLKSQDLSAEIHHHPGQSAKLVLSFEKREHNRGDSEMGNIRCSNKLLVTNIPAPADKDLLEMFFEDTKRQGGGPVRCVSLDRKENCAVVEFEKPGAVQKVLDKQPVKMLGTTVKVEMYDPYLDKGESLKSVELTGIKRDLIDEIADMKLKHIIDNDDAGDDDDDDGSDDDFFSSAFRKDLFLATPFGYRMPSGHRGVVCNGCGGRVLGTRYKCRSCKDFDFCSRCKDSVPHNPRHKFQTIRH